jgi:hypothetical protein
VNGGSLRSLSEVGHHTETRRIANSLRQDVVLALSVCYDSGPVPGDELIGNVIEIIADDLRLGANS